VSKATGTLKSVFKTEIKHLENNQAAIIRRLKAHGKLDIGVTVCAQQYINLREFISVIPRRRPPDAIAESYLSDRAYQDDNDRPDTVENIRKASAHFLIDRAHVLENIERYYIDGIPRASREKCGD
jgi:hypothetical protein